MEINFAHIGDSLGTRVLGKKIRLEIEKSLKSENFVTFNFRDVRLISHSFADECFGKLLLSWSIEELKSKTTFIGANSIIKKTIAFTLEERANNLELA